VVEVLAEEEVVSVKVLADQFTAFVLNVNTRHPTTGEPPVYQQNVQSVE
jgi:hypothetical protein